MSASEPAPRGAGERWWGFGPPRDAEAERRLLREVEHALGAPAPQRPELPLELLEPAPSRLSGEAREALAAHGALAEDDATRALAAHGSAYPDLVRRRRGQVDPAPDAVLRPTDLHAVAPLLRTAAAFDVVVVPRGGGTSLVGGVDATGGGERSGLVTLDLRSLNRVVDVDPISRRATFAGGIAGPELEGALRPYGLTLGHLPPTFERSTLGGWIATRSTDPWATGGGAIADAVRAARLATPVGVLESGDAPRAGEGPDLLGVVAGSEGALGVIVQATVLVHPRPEAQAGRALLFRSFEEGLTAVRRLVQEGLAPDRLRLADDDETRLALAALGVGRSAARLRGRGDGSLLVLVSAGTAGAASAAVDAAVEACNADEPHDLGPEPARRALLARHQAPQLRDALVERGYLVDTFATSTRWSALPALRDAVVAAVRTALGEPCLVGTAVGSVTADGATLSMTAVAPVEPDAELERWSRARAAALGAILAEGGSVDGIGSHRPQWLARARGRTVEGALRALKDALDPLDVANPGKLLPPGA